MLKTDRIKKRLLSFVACMIALVILWDYFPSILYHIKSSADMAYEYVTDVCMFYGNTLEEAITDCRANGYIPVESDLQQFQYRQNRKDMV